MKKEGLMKQAVEWCKQDKHEDLYYRVDKVEIFDVDGDAADSIDEYAWIEGELKL